MYRNRYDDLIYVVSLLAGGLSMVLMTATMIYSLR
jgi:hypothetical protein